MGLGVVVFDTRAKVYPALNFFMTKFMIWVGIAFLGVIIFERMLPLVHTALASFHCFVPCIIL